MDSEGEDTYYSSDEELAEVEKEEPSKPYTILKEDEIKQLQQNHISDVSSLLSVSRSVACTLLVQNKWTPTSVYEQWFSNGSASTSSSSSSNSVLCNVCNICFENQQNTDVDMVSASCGHLFCVPCWRTYISISIKDGPGCLKLPCPEPGCDAQPGLDMVVSLSSADDADRYYRYLYRSYVESNPTKMKWCPSPGCDFAIRFDAEDGSGDYQVTCDCGYKMCWKCSEESHSPLDCSTVSKWMEKNRSEAENTTWILAYTKPCPKCHRAIEKNQGCNHMTCREPCRYQFCWVCLRGFGDHNQMNCNKYTHGAKTNEKENAKNHLEKYTHYYERWDANDKARVRALADLQTAREQHLERLSLTQSETMAQLQCVVEAWDQIAECRRVLKWTYAYGYYLSENGPLGKLDFFGHLQGEAENALERLHHLAEKEMVKYLNFYSESFMDFRMHLVNLTVITKNYFGNLVRALENNLEEVDNTDVKSSKKRKEIQESWRKKAQRKGRR